MMRQMKDSGIEWIGEIPETWNVIRIGSQYTERKTKVSDTEYPPLSVTIEYDISIFADLQTESQRG